MLTDKQKLTIKHLKDIRGYTDSKEIINFCLDKLDKPRRSGKKDASARVKSRTTSRKFSKKYYQGIINYFAQGNKLIK